MKKVFIAAAIILTSGLTAWSVTKSNDIQTVKSSPVVKPSDFAAKSYTGNKSNLATIE